VSKSSTLRANRLPRFPSRIGRVIFDLSYVRWFGDRGPFASPERPLDDGFLLGVAVPVSF
jgi:hypothetical protein